MVSVSCDQAVNDNKRRAKSMVFRFIFKEIVQQK